MVGPHRRQGAVPVFGNVQRTLLYEKVVDLIKDMLRRGELQPGDHLPAERHLVEKLSVSRGTLREAFRVLELEGLIEARPGGGRYVRRSLPVFSGTEDIFANLEKAAIWDLLEVREVLEAKIVELACARANQTDLEALDDALHTAQAYALSTSEAVNADQSFHLSLARASHNLVFVNIMRLHLEMLRRTREFTVRQPGRRDEMMAEHREIAEAVKSRNAPEAVAALHRHLHSIRNRLAQAPVGQT